MGHAYILQQFHRRHTPTIVLYRIEIVDTGYCDVSFVCLHVSNAGIVAKPYVVYGVSDDAIG